MIQRIQTLYLFIVLILSVSLFFIPLYGLETAVSVNGSASSATRYFGVQANVVYLVLNVATGLLALISMLMFRNRRMQIRLCNLDMLILCIFIGTIFYFADHSKADAAGMVHYTTGCYLPLVQLVFTFLALRSIKKDEALIRSADRLR